MSHLVSDRATPVAYFDCFSGISGDMALAALVDAGVEAEYLRAELGKLPLPGLDLQVERARRAGLSGTRVIVVSREAHPPPRNLAAIETIIGESALSPAVQRRAVEAFRRLAEAESLVHGVPVPEVHFHEVGAADAIADIVGFAIGLEYLGVRHCFASSLPMGRGIVQGAHGPMPLPAPATLALLASVGAPIHHVDLEAELVTPTGAALLASAARFERPAMRLGRIGVGLGTRELPWPNALRLWLGEATADVASEGLDLGEAVVIQTNLDDATPEELGYAMERLFAAGALDVFFTPAQMKKNRPAVQMTVLATPATAPALARAMLRETTSLGVRFWPVQRLTCPRRAGTVETPFGVIEVTIKTIDGEDTVCPEYEACARIARNRGVPIREVYAAVFAAGIRRPPPLPSGASEPSGG